MGDMFDDDDDDIITSIRRDYQREIPTLSQLRQQIRDEIIDPDIKMLRNFRHLSLDQLDSFHADTGLFEIPDPGGLEGEDPAKFVQRKVHAQRSYHYKIGKFDTAPYYLNYLSNEMIDIPGSQPESIRNQTLRLSLNPKSDFRSTFKLPLYMIEALAAQLVDAEIVKITHHCRTPAILKMKSELLVLGALAILSGTTSGFRNLRITTHICATDHSRFFKKFVSYLFDRRHEYIYLPRNAEELKTVMRSYEEMGLPGAMGSVDVVHVKWSNCPAGDFNRAKGKESYPSLAFECISDFNRRICHVHGPQFGVRNDKHIVKMDVGVSNIETVYSNVRWKFFDESGNIQNEKGAYLICDNGYLQWPTLICPFMRSEGNTPLESCFSENVESVRKDVECCFGILKKRWKTLDRGFQYRDINICQHIFVACCVLHNMMLDEMVREEPPPRVGRGHCMPNDGMWLDGPTENPVEILNASATTLKLKFHRRRNILAHHLWVWKSKCKNGEIK